MPCTRARVCEMEKEKGGWSSCGCGELQGRIGQVVAGEGSWKASMHVTLSISEYLRPSRRNPFARLSSDRHTVSEAQSRDGYQRFVFSPILHCRAEMISGYGLWITCVACPRTRAHVFGTVLYSTYITEPRCAQA